MSVIVGRPVFAGRFQDFPARVAGLAVTSAAASTFWPESGDKILYGAAYYQFSIGFSVLCSKTVTSGIQGALNWWLEKSDDGAAWTQWLPVAPYTFKVLFPVANAHIPVAMVITVATLHHAATYARIRMQVASGSATVVVPASASPDVYSYVEVVRHGGGIVV